MGVTLVGSLLPVQAWTGAVVSASQTAINILHPDGFLISIIAEPGNMTCLSVCIDSTLPIEKAATGSVDGISAGMLARMDYTSIDIAGLRIGLERARVWDGGITQQIPGDFIVSLILELRSVLAGVGRKGGLLGVLAPDLDDNAFASSAGERLARAWRESGGSGLLDLSFLVGLGCGLTPSGDDFITGMLLAEALTAGIANMDGSMSGPSSKSAAPRIDRAKIRDRLRTTNSAGKSLLLGALKGQFPAYLIVVAEACTGKLKEEMRYSAFCTGIRHGSASGTDSLVGLVWGLELVQFH